MMDFSGLLQIVGEGLFGAGQQVLQIALIVIPLMVVMQFLEELKILEKISRHLERVVSVIGISGAGALPLLVGLTLGLAYGAGMIIKYGKEGKLSQQEMVLIITFLSLNHSLFEDVLLFVAIGAQGTVLQVIRMVVAVVLTATLARFLKVHNNRISEIKSNRKDNRPENLTTNP